MSESACLKLLLCSLKRAAVQTDKGARALVTHPLVAPSISEDKVNYESVTKIMELAHIDYDQRMVLIDVVEQAILNSN